MRRLLLSLLVPFALANAKPPPSPAELYGNLFQQVQMEGVLPDEKDFVDCVPKHPPAEIVAAYEEKKDQPGFDLGVFVRENFIVPRGTDDVRKHIEMLWAQLERDSSKAPATGSLIPLPHPYVVPGGRFEELYYWDSYFVMLGLKESGRVEMLERMVENFAHLIETFGFIPNANRTYYLTRSQPPFFSLMVDLLADAKGEAVYRKFRPALETEYRFWMDPARGHAVQLGDQILNRYHDSSDAPREEQYRTDRKLASSTKRDSAQLYRDVRSAAESGWDFSSRWFADGRNRATIRTTEILPVDLNCLLEHLERTLVTARKLDGDESGANEMAARADTRRTAINAKFWSAESRWYVDYDLSTGRQSKATTLAGMMPFFLNIAPKDRLAPAAEILKRDFLKPGGVVTTLLETGEQWDAPNGWAPLQWITIQGLRNYGDMTLAKEIALRWIRQNLKVYRATGKLMEKYDVIDLSKPGGGGEYPAQDGFGWTNGVLLKLLNLYGEP
jgi:alpha,alpha-trehalase